jgi:catechol 2,3-dioxygenase-like lactoylglutathione lyase family enzyme
VFDHVVLNVADIKASKAFYTAALGSLGMGIVVDQPGGVAFGPEGRPMFWIAARQPASTGVHIALHCEDRDSVDAFHGAAMEAGGTDNGAPGLREIYHPTYYGAFVLDPDGNNIEAVCHTAP